MISILFSNGCSDQKQKVISGKVVGSSMVPALLGEHRTGVCSDCNFTFAFEPVEVDTTRRVTVCPNCGAANRIQDAVQGAADLVSILPGETVNRWDVVAFESPNGEAGIKRVVGLPGETITMKSGDLYVDSKIMTKPLSVQRRMRILVNDSHFIPSSLSLPRWRSDRVETAFRLEGGKWIFDVGQNNSTDRATNLDTTDLSGIDWLKYHHWRCFQHGGSRTNDFAVEDGYAYNQSLGRNLHKMDDLFLEVQLEKGSAGTVAWRFNRGELQVEFQLDLDKWELTVVKHAASSSPIEFERRQREANQTVSKKIQRHRPADDRIVIEFSSFDAQLVVAVNGDEAFRIQSPSEHSKVALYPLEIGVAGSSVMIERIRIWRDVYYFPVPEEPADDPIMAGEGLILLGDNVPLSIDSRHWNQPGIHRSKLIGVVRSESDVRSQ